MQLVEYWQFAVDSLPPDERWRGRLGERQDQQHSSRFGANRLARLAAAIIASNGTSDFFRFVDAGDDESVVPELIAQHLVEPGMVLPVNIRFFDPTGQAARMLIETPDGTPPLKVLS